MQEVIAQELGNREGHSDGDQAAILPTPNGANRHRSSPTPLRSHSRRSQSPSPTQNSRGKSSRSRILKGKGDLIDSSQEEFVHPL